MTCKRHGCERPVRERGKSCCSHVCAWIYREQQQLSRLSLKYSGEPLDQRQDRLDEIERLFDVYRDMKYRQILDARRSNGAASHS